MFQAMKPMVSGKANERWERRSSPNSALFCTSVNSCGEGSLCVSFEGGGASVATESPRVADAVVTGIGAACPRAPVQGHGGAQGPVQQRGRLSEVTSGKSLLASDFGR